MLINIMRAALSAGVFVCFMLAPGAVRAFEMGPLSDVIEPRSDGEWTVVARRAHVARPRARSA